MSLMGTLFPLRLGTILAGYVSLGANRKSQKLFPFVKVAEKHRDIPII